MIAPCKRKEGRNITYLLILFIPDGTLKASTNGTISLVIYDADFPISPLVIA
jgi:hypothetical protein